MSLVLKNILGFILMAVIVIAGVFCYQGIQSMNTHCSGETSSVWCSDFTSHGTIISDAILTTVLAVLSVLVSILLIKPFLNLFRLIKQTETLVLKIRDKISILSPIQLAISDGIIHPKIP